MIPKIIHYCWFGRGSMPDLALKCLKSWKENFPDYEIKEWNEDNFNVNITSYTAEAYAAKKYAFVSDYARFWILYYYGGIYFDTDVEVLKPINDIIDRGPFMACENEVKNSITSLSVAPGLGLGINVRSDFYKELLDLYNTLHFQTLDGKLNLKTVVEYTTELFIQKGLKNINEIQNVEGIWIYPKDYFCPIDYETKKCVITKNTRTIHHFAESWKTPSMRIKMQLIRFIGKKNAVFLSRLKRLF